MENTPQRQKLAQMSQDEIEVINDIRRIGFGRVAISIQNGVIVSKEITKIVKNSKRKNNPNSDKNR